ncbi:MAG: hypothetical protein LBF61_08000 [Azoarcus sp.]|jgi:hypothetical protein|nr:hypothetical protein [Azoarcus sp.]
MASAVFDRYEREITPKKAPRTQRDDAAILDMLRKVFGAMRLDDITPQHIAIYRDKRGEKAPVRANREISLLSNIFNIAREWGVTAKENPCRGVRKNKEHPRDYYAEDADKAGDHDLAARIRAFQFRDIRPKTASDIELGHASNLLGHTKEEITRNVYRRKGETAKPAK